MELCIVDDCQKPSKKRSMCYMHYQRLNRHGDVHYEGRRSPVRGVTQESKREYIIAYKLDQGCADCGYNEHPCALDFDHLPGTEKVRDIKCGQHLGWTALMEEIAKCDVVCANCHRIRTYTRKHEPADVQ